MTPRFAAYIAALFIAYLAWTKPERVSEIAAQWYVKFTGNAAPVEINSWVAWSPKILVILVISFVALDLLVFTRQSYREFREGRRRSQNAVIKDARNVAKENEAHPRSPFDTPYEDHRTWRNR